MKKDIKYIIKRIVVGVGIAVILGILKTNNVFAEEINVNLDKPDIQFNDNGYLLYDLTSSYSSNIYNYKFPFNLSDDNKSYIIFYNDDLNIYLYYFFTNISDYSVDIKDIKMNYDNKSNNFIYSYKCTSNNSNCDNDYMQIGGLDTSFYLSNKVIDDFSSLSTENTLNKYDSPINNEYFYWKYGSAFPLENFSNDFKLFGTNLTSLTINNDNIYNSMNNYTEIDISDYQAIYFVPKNYSLVDTEFVSNIEFIKFPFYFKGNINKGYFNINDNQQIVFEPPNPTTGGSETEFTYVDTSFPMHYSESGTTANDLCAYIIYNTGTSTKIRFNSNEFDYYLVQDLHNYSQEITFIDDHNNQVSKTIQFSKTLQEMWEEGLNNNNDYWLSGFLNGGFADNISGYFDLLKLPFNFLKSLSRDKCSSITLPIPFINGNLSLNCLSGLFRNVLGNNFYNIIFYLISGLYAYRITIMNIDSLTDVLNPSDDKIEVIDL